MSNHFVWAWKLTRLGVPVVLAYLGFARADEMADRGAPFADAADWRRLVQAHGAALFPPSLWDRAWGTGRETFAPLIRTLEVPLG